MLLVGVVPALAQGNGQIEGRVTRENGKGLGGVTVVLNELGAVKITDNNGHYRFDDVPAGSYSVSMTLGDNAQTATVEVASGAIASVDTAVDWDVSFADTITVFSASRRRERIVEAPAAVTSVSEEQIEREISHGQLPKLLEFTPGVEVTQSGMFDYNLNTRGFNSSLNRRLVVLVDGRDPSVPFLASQEWVTISQYMNDLESAELVRGPSSALYGANAFNGVLNLVTKSPRYSQGGEFRLTGGDLSTKKADFRWAGDLGNDWYIKLNGSYLNSDDFSVDRNRSVEYSRRCLSATDTGCLFFEAIPRVVDQNDVVFGNLRFDKHLKNGDFFTFEGGSANAEGPALQTGIGRFSLPEIERLWGRFNYTSDHWNLLGYYNDRKGNRQTSLTSGRETFLASENYQLEAQTNWDFNDGKVRLVAGLSYGEDKINTANEQGIQTLVFEPVDSDSQAVFAQVDFDLSDKIKLVLAGRYDESSLHDSQFSPKGSLVYRVNSNNTLRLSYNEAFQVANYSEFFLQADAAVPLNLQPFEGICALAGVSCGFSPGPTRILALGNKDLQVEEVTSLEVGYTGIINNKAFVTVDYYSNELKNFITDLLPNVGTSLGRLNPSFGPYRPPSNLPEPFASLLLASLQGALGPSFALLTNNLDGTPALGAVSYTNFGEVDTQGVDLGINVFVNPKWRVNANYSWFDFDIKQELAGDPLQPNAPENKYGFGFAYVDSKFDAAINYRWVDDFQWVVGTLFRGTVESYNTVDLNANYRFDESWEVGLNVSNLLDDEHWESFGGDLIGRRALAHVAYRW